MPDTMISYGLNLPDNAAVHAAADAQVDEGYRHNTRIGDGLDALRKLLKELPIDDQGAFGFIVDSLNDANDGMTRALDGITSAIAPLHPTGGQS